MHDTFPSSMFRYVKFVGKLSRAAVAVPTLRLASFVQEELPELPKESIIIPSNSELTNQFLLKQNSIQSAQAAARYYEFEFR